MLLADTVSQRREAGAGEKEKGNSRTACKGKERAGTERERGTTTAARDLNDMTAIATVCELSR